MKLLISIITLCLMNLNIVLAEEQATFDGELLTVPVVNTPNQMGKFEEIHFKLAKDGRWDLIHYNEPSQVMVESVSINVLESFPIQIHVVASGYFSNGCGQIGKTHILQKGTQFNIVVNTTIAEIIVACTAALVPFEVNIPLEVNELEAGIYDVNVNGIENTFELMIDNF